jgi:type IV pilus assembly protein PilV
VQSGFTLMEVLITVVILSIGLLGLAGLQFDALRANQNAYLSSLATAQAWDAADRLRSNSKGVIDKRYDKMIQSVSSSTDCAVSDCSASELANYDANKWHGENARLLPDGQGVICLDSTPDDGVSQASHGCDGQSTTGIRLFAVKVWWNDDRDPNTALRRHVMSFVP